MQQPAVPVGKDVKHAASAQDVLQSELSSQQYVILNLILFN
jgi:hypothetical protein